MKKERLAYYVGAFETKALENGEIREIRLPDEPRHIFSSKAKAERFVEAILSISEREGAKIEKDTHNPDDPDECWFLTNGENEWYIVLECTTIK